MKMYKISSIEELLQCGIESGDNYVGFEINDNNNLIMIFKTNEPDWRDDGFGEAVMELELLEDEGEY